MTEEKKDYKQKIDELLSNYVDGQDIFKKAHDWDYPVRMLPGAENARLPQTWLELADAVIAIIAHDKYGLDTYDNAIEIVGSEEMREAYVHSGMPVSYDHWSFGKRREELDEQYESGRMGLAYEMIINSNPSIAYCMGENTKTMQLLVIAHACYGHNSFFKTNYLFKQHTDANHIIGDLIRLKEYVLECESRYGQEKVEKLLDACHALEGYGVNRYTRPPRRTEKEEEALRNRLAEDRIRSVNVVLDRTKRDSAKTDFQSSAAEQEDTIPAEPEENIMRFIATYAPHLKDWERNIIRMISDTQQYFYPQIQTKVMNEGWASFWHYTIMDDLYDLDLIDDGMRMEFAKDHTSVLWQRDGAALNPYAIGAAVLFDLKRMCLEPTDEDREWFPNIAGNPDWLSVIKDACENYKDENFFLQYLSPKVMRDFRLFAIFDDDREKEYTVTAIHDDEGYKDLRRVLNAQYRLSDMRPMVEAVKYDYRGDRSLTLRHIIRERRPVDLNDAEKVLKHVNYLWQHPVFLESTSESGTVVKKIGCPPIPEPPAPRRR